MAQKKYEPGEAICYMARDPNGESVIRWGIVDRRRDYEGYIRYNLSVFIFKPIITPNCNS